MSRTTPTHSSQWTISRLQAIRSIAQVDPILAFQLSSNAHLETFLREYDALISANIQKIPAKDIPPDLCESIATAARDGLAEEMLADLERDMMNVSQRIGVVTYRRVQKLLRRTSSNTVFEGKLREQLKAYLTKVLPETLKTCNQTENRPARIAAEAQ